MKKTTMYCLAVLAVMLAAVLVPAGKAAAQSEQELRREVERLREENRSLQRELESARRQIQNLESTVERLNDQLRRLRTDRPDDRPVEERVSIDESVPHASPRALFNAMRTSYGEEMSDMEIGEAGDRQRALYLRGVERWRARVNRNLRSQIEWQVRVLESETTRVGYALTVVAIDPETEVRLGEPFDVELPRRIARRYEQLVDRRQADRLQIRGVLVPNVQVNADRREAGPFNVPQLIGPFAEFGFRVELSAVTHPTDDESPGRREQP